MAELVKIGNETILCISLSTKMSDGVPGKSAAFNLLNFTYEHVKAAYPEMYLLDIRSYPIPLFSGGLPEKINDYNYKFWTESICQCGGILFSIPAYWSGLSGMAKNFFDILCGPAYDLVNPGETIFTGKAHSAFIVGADEKSALMGANQYQHMMEQLGANQVIKPVIISNPRKNDVNQHKDSMILTLASLAHSVACTHKTQCTHEQ